MKIFEKIICTLYIAIILFVVIINVQQISFNKGMSAGCNSIRITSVQPTESGYLVLIRDVQDKLYIHSIKK